MNFEWIANSKRLNPKNNLNINELKSISIIYNIHVINYILTKIMFEIIYFIRTKFKYILIK